MAEHQEGLIVGAIKLVVVVLAVIPVVIAIRS